MVGTNTFLDPNMSQLFSPIFDILSRYDVLIHAGGTQLWFARCVMRSYLGSVDSFLATTNRILTMYEDAF
jgi:hypothetical protein